MGEHRHQGAGGGGQRHGLHDLVVGKAVHDVHVFGGGGLDHDMHLVVLEAWEDASDGAFVGEGCHLEGLGTDTTIFLERHGIQVNFVKVVDGSTK